MAGSGRVEFEKKVIFGYVCAQVGTFKSGRGCFNERSLQKAVEIWPSNGLRCRFTHPDLFSDGLGKFLGRSRNPRIERKKLVADLHLDPSAFTTPSGNLGQYVMDLANSDRDALSSSLVLESDKIADLDERGRQRIDEEGCPTPPLWMPTRLHASDVVDTGDAVDSFLSAYPDFSMDRMERELRHLAIHARFLQRELGDTTGSLSIIEKERKLASLKKPPA